MAHADVIVIGGGIAGVSIAYELAATHQVVLLEREAVLAYHTTGRSAAVFLETYGPQAIQALTVASRAFYDAPTVAVDAPLLTPRGFLQCAIGEHRDELVALHARVNALVPSATLLDADELRELYPLLRPGYAEAGLLEPDAADINVAGLLQGFTRGLRGRGGRIVLGAAVSGLARAEGVWTAETTGGESFSSPLIVNAAGAWADVVAGLAGARPAGLVPKRRSAYMVPSPDAAATRELPFLADLENTFYLKPDGDGFLCSPSDASPTVPGDAKADELEIARSIEAINEATTLGIRSVRTPWAGLRTFAADGEPVVGYDPAVEGFFWCAGQGGYGIQTAPALARTGAALARGEAVPGDVAALGLRADQLAPGRAGLA